MLNTFEGGSVIRFSRNHVIFLAAFISALVSRIGMLLTGYTSDDYFYALNHVDATWHAIHQGRFLAPIVFSAMNLSGFTQTAIQLPLFVISLFVIASLITKLVSMCLNRTSPLLVGVAAAAVAASYPYLTSYYLFRMVILDQIVIYGIVLLAIHILTNENIKDPRKMWLGSLVVGAGCGYSQLVFILFSIGAMAWFARMVFPIMDAKSIWQAHDGKSETIWTILVAPTIILSSLLMYFMITKIVQAATGIGGEGSYSIDVTRGVGNIMITDLRLVFDVLMRGESIIPLYMKVALLSALAIFTVQASIISVRKAALCIAFLFFGVAISVAPMAVSAGGHVARIFVGTGFAAALFIALIGNLVPNPKVAGIAVLVLCVFYAGSGATMFYQQHLLSQWDQRTAWSIYKDMATQFDITEHTSIHLVNGSKINGTRLSTYGDADYGVNESALRSDWSYAFSAVFNVATGRKLDVSSAPPSVCAGKPIWPRSGSIFPGEGSNIYVCL